MQLKIIASLVALPLAVWAMQQWLAVYAYHIDFLVEAGYPGAAEPDHCNTDQQPADFQCGRNEPCGLFEG